VSPIYDHTKKLLVEKFGVAEDQVTPEATFEDLDLDSLDLVEFSMAADEEFGVSISDEEAEQLTTVNETAKLLESKGAVVQGAGS